MSFVTKMKILATSAWQRQWWVNMQLSGGNYEKYFCYLCFNRTGHMSSNIIRFIWQPLHQKLWCRTTKPTSMLQYVHQMKAWEYALFFWILQLTLSLELIVTFFLLNFSLTLLPNMCCFCNDFKQISHH